MKKLLVGLLLLCFPLILSAQKDLRKGFVISTTGDTLFGMLSFQGDIKNSQECIFYSNIDSKKDFYPFDIKAYRFENGKFYISKYILKPDTVCRVFAECLVSGKKDVFYYRDFAGFHYLIEASDSSLLEIPYKQEIVNIQDKSYVQESTQHIEVLKSYFADCPSLFSEIENIKKPYTKELIRITKTYHNVVCGENSCVVYNKKHLPLKIAFEPRFEIIKFRGSSEHFLQYGGLFHFWLPESNEKIFVKTGFMYSSFPDDYSLYKIPLQFEYLFPGKIIRPKFDVGINTYIVKSQKYTEVAIPTLAASGGFLVHITDFMFLDLNVETDILTLTYKTEFFMLQTVGIGLFLLF